MSTFSEQFAALGAPVLDGHLAEAVTYTPRSGAARSVSGHVVETDAYTDDVTGKVHESTLTLHVARDASTGIDSPAVADAVTYGGVAYAYTGERSAVSPTHWTLHFRRRVTERHAPQG